MWFGNIFQANKKLLQFLLLHVTEVEKIDYNSLLVNTHIEKYVFSEVKFIFSWNRDKWYNVFLLISKLKRNNY
jgi:hypothetical protein